jgi:hypothetical protein
LLCNFPSYTDYHFTVKDNSSLTPTIAAVLKQGLQSLVQDKDPATLNKEFLEKHPQSVPHLLAGMPFVSHFFFFTAQYVS